MRFSTPFSRRSLAVGASALVSAVIMGGAAAQEATPVATPGGPSEGYPVTIHQGTCAELSSELAFEIGQAITFGTNGEGDPQTVGAEGGVSATLLGVSTTVEESIDTLGNDGHAIVVHASPDDDTVIACGQIAGVVNEGELALSIAPMGDATLVGVAILSDDDGSTLTKVYLFDTAVAEAEATPAS